MNAERILDDLHWRGLALTGAMPHANEFTAHLKTCPVFPGHVIAQGDGVARNWEGALDREVLSHRMADVLAAPHFFDFAVKFTPAIARFFGEPPVMYSFNAFWTRPGPTLPDVNIQQWHRDRDDRKFVALFMYGTDVASDEQGPHLYVTGSHKTYDDGNRPPVSFEEVQRVSGIAGTTFLECPRGLHMGIKPVDGERLLAWARWGVSEKPRSYLWDKLEPVAASSLALTGEYSDDVKTSTRLTVDWGA